MWERRRNFHLAVGLLLSGTAIALAAVAVGEQNQGGGKYAEGMHTAPPYWAYAVNPPAAKNDRKADVVDTSLRRVPNSEAAFTVLQTSDLFYVPDWHPGGHPPMPGIVAHGRKPKIFACGYCHLPNGFGRPENANLAGLPADYIAEQMSDFKNGLRKTSVPEFLPAVSMGKYEQLASEQEVREAAAYFTGIKPKPWIRVLETDSVPKTQVAGWMLVAWEPREMEPIGARIIETPENLERTELRDDTSGFIAYVPVGSIATGKALVTTGGEGKTVPCATCHGTGLQGMKDVPGIAGRSPSYVVRQIVDMQNGLRAGAGSQQMKSVVAKLNIEDMIAIAAYTASLNP